MDESLADPEILEAVLPKLDDDYAQELLDTFAIESGKTISKMSKGQRARVGLTIALAHRPEFLVLDEPSSGLDPVVRNDILAAIIRTIADSGNTVLFSSHLLDEVQRVSDMVGVIRDGELIECGPLESPAGALPKSNHRHEKWSSR